MQFYAFFVDLKGIETFSVSMKLLIFFTIVSLSIESCQRQQPSFTFLLIYCNLEFPILVVSLFYHFFALPNLSLSVLHTLKPFSFVVRILIPVHFSESMTEIFDKSANIVTASSPCVLTFSVSFVIYILAFVFLFTELPNSAAKSESIFELSFIG